jgi:hypothetical protein
LLLAGALLTTLLLAALLLLARFLVGILVHYGVLSNGWFEVFFLTPRPNALDNAPPRHSFRVSGAGKAVGTDCGRQSLRGSLLLRKPLLPSIDSITRRAASVAAPAMPC